MPMISVVVVNYNAGDYLKGCISSLLCQSFKDFEVIIIDNASSDGSIDALSLLPRHFRIIRETQNLGFAKANNKGVELSSGQWIALLNPDAAAAPDWLERLMFAVAHRPDHRIVASAQYSMTNPAMLDGVGDCYSISGYPWRGGYGLNSRSLPPAGEVFAACGASAFYPREAFLLAGGFDESYFCYIEDVDLGFRLRLRGERCQFDPACRVDHIGFASSGSDSAFAAYHSARNIIWTAVKNLPIPLLFIVFPFWVMVSLVLVFKAAPLRKRAIIRGIRDAIIEISGPLKARAKVQRNRKLGWIAVARLISWNLMTMRHHLPVVYPFR